MASGISIWYSSELPYLCLLVGVGPALPLSPGRSGTRLTSVSWSESGSSPDSRCSAILSVMASSSLPQMVVLMDASETDPRQPIVTVRFGKWTRNVFRFEWDTRQNTSSELPTWRSHTGSCREKWIREHVTISVYHILTFLCLLGFTSVPIAPRYWSLCDTHVS